MNNMTPEKLKSITHLVMESIIKELTPELMLEYITFDELTENMIIDFRYRREFSLKINK